ncbi:glycosyltransferase family 2 protein [Cellulomonas cellasea]|uniref:Cellulose synthase (UDP-forming) n=1 Tax=Cellulomonas cellasea TaxID=43670 RepID=A0A7W4UIN6_9CELL|nr:glycosyltransferase family 2 protein [Cellulomonas cellasea]MBB2924887.1 cellulose synthase (UDP-forming) [Cellulomonas cellasea]
MRRQLVLRVAVLLAVTLGLNYTVWRWLESVNWSAWWIAVPLVIAETYSFIDVAFFGMTMWRAKDRETPPPPSEGATADVFITTYDEPVEMVMTTALAARDIRYPHQTYVLDDGARPELRAAADAAGIGYIVRTADWADRPRHAKAGNLNNAMLTTDGEFILILDADQIPDPAILDRTLGYFTDDRVALVQTPQYFTNVPDADPLGSQAPLFYGPIQQGKDGWNAAFFCGSNAVLRRDALMQLGLVGYVRETERTVREALKAGATVLARSRRQERDPRVLAALDEVEAAVRDAQRRLHAQDPISEVTFDFQRRVGEVSASMVTADVDAMRADLAAISAMSSGRHVEEVTLTVDDAALRRLSSRDWSPLGAVESVRALVAAVDVDRSDEAQAVMPVATVSVTEDMATAMRLHALGWRTVYHHERLADGLAPEDLGTMITQRLRWAQGTLQVMLKESPLTMRGLRWSQRVMYFSTMWSYLSGFAAVVYLAAPIIFLCFGVLPVTAWTVDFFARFIPFQLASQLLFVVAAHGVKTWRGQQYSLALFPVWIKATVTATANVWFGRPLGFAVTPKVRQDGGGSWRLVLPQLVAMGALVVAALIGLVRFGLGYAPWMGTFVNLAWVAYDLVVLSVIVEALRYRGYAGPTGTTPGSPTGTTAVGSTSSSSKEGQ